MLLEFGLSRTVDNDSFLWSAVGFLLPYPLVSGCTGVFSEMLESNSPVRLGTEEPGSALLICVGG